MPTIELNDGESSMLHEMLRVQLRDLLHELHHTDDRAFRQLLKQKAEMIERLLARVPAGDEEAEPGTAG